MSVLKSKRGESAMQFIETARELEIYTIKQCARFPKRFMFLITKDEVQLRRNYLITANCELQCLISQLDIAREFVRNTDSNKPINGKVWQTWIDLITTEAKLLAALKNKDKERYKTLLE